MHYLLTYEFVDDHAARREPLSGEHLAHALAAVTRGELRLGGATGDPADGAVLWFEGESPTVAERFAESDPYVREGLVRRWRVTPWRIAVGADADWPVHP